jgi:hypothetical protein
MNYDLLSVAQSAAARNTLERERAAEARRKLAKSAAELGASAPSEEENFLVGQWTDTRQSVGLGEDHYQVGGRDPDFD